MSEQIPHSDEQIYCSYLKQETAERGDCPEPADLAAYLDDQCSSEQQQSIESHLANCAVCLIAIAETRFLIDSDIEAAPKQVIDSVKSLVKPMTIEAGNLSRMRFTLRPLAAAAALGICALGYITGVGIKAEAMSSDQLAHEMSFGVFESLEDDEQELELLALLIKENSQ